jgi:quercetin dioxygenase-like cupin family protein
MGKIMKAINILEKFELGGQVKTSKNKEVRELFNGARARIIEIKLSENAVLTKHTAPEPITVLCLAGKGIFKAGEQLDEQTDLTAGVLLTLEAGILHEVAAEPAIHILVTRFKDI